MKLYRLNVTADGEPTAIFVLAEDVDSLLHALEYQDHGEADEESLLPYFDGEKKPRAIRSLEDVPEDYLDFVCLGDNPEQYTVAEFFDTQELTPSVQVAWRNQRQRRTRHPASGLSEPALAVCENGPRCIMA
jgi:hypothetical protein